MSSKATAPKTTSSRAVGKYQKKTRQGNILKGHRITDVCKTSFAKRLLLISSDLSTWDGFGKFANSLVFVND